MSTHPWFKFFAKEWLLSNFIRTSSAEERGVYIQLLAEQWQNGGFLPTDDASLYRISACDDRGQWERVRGRVLARFAGRSEDGSEMWNAKLRELQQNAIELSKDRAEAGRAGNDIKKQKASKRDAIAYDLRSQTSRDKDKDQDEEEEPFDPAFDGSKAFEGSVALYPEDRREYSQGTTALYFEAIADIRQAKKISSREAVARLDAGLIAYVARVGKFAVSFSKYLREKLYKNELATTPPTATLSHDEEVELDRELLAASLRGEIPKLSKHRNRILSKRGSGAVANA